MNKLLNGIVEFREKLLPDYRETFRKLALGQAPDALFIACSDSRVVPNLFASTDPGDLFVVRNVGNMIPKCHQDGRSPSECSEAAALEFSLQNLPITDVIVCGHSHCGAARALLENRHDLSPNLRNWLRHGTNSLMRLRAGEVLDSSLSTVDQLSQINVLQQLEHLKTYPIVQQAMEAGRLRLHAWWFEISQAEVFTFNSSLARFVPIDREQSQIIMEELSPIATCSELHTH